jgi:(S)-ureidoglycine aminohydrolase
MRPDQYNYAPPDIGAAWTSPQGARLAVIEKIYRPLAGSTAPAAFTGDENTVAPQALLDDPAIQVRRLLPDDMAFDFAVNTMSYDPGASLPMVEMHVMEHGLLMLAGEGIYRLGDSWYPVAAGDFIWMAPYCPQWFGALGKKPAKYLIYKDWNRHPLA